MFVSQPQFLDHRVDVRRDGTLESPQRIFHTVDHRSDLGLVGREKRFSAPPRLCSLSPRRTNTGDVPSVPLHERTGFFARAP